MLVTSVTWPLSKGSNSEKSTYQWRTDTREHSIPLHGVEAAQINNRQWGEQFTPDWPLKVNFALKCLIEVVFVDVNAVLNFKSWAFSRICGHCQQHFNAHTFGELATFSVDFCIFCWMSAIFLLPVCLIYWPRKYTTRVDPHVDNPTKFEVDMTTHCRVIAQKLRYVTWPCDLYLWPFDLEQLTYMADHVTNPATKFEGPTTICLWVTSYNGFRWLPLKMRTRPLRMRRITWPRFAYSLCNFGGSTMKVIKVICENNARPCVKRRMSFCACAKSRDLLKMP